MSEEDPRLFEFLERQLDELIMLQACFPEEGEIVIGTTDEKLRQLMCVAGPERDESLCYSSLPDPRPLVEVSVRIDSDINGKTVVSTLSFSFPPTYPDVSPTVALRADAFSTCEQESTNATITAVLADLVGDEAVLATLEAVRDALASAATAAVSSAKIAEEGKKQKQEEWKRCCFWVNHMFHGKQHKKEAAVVGLANQYGLAGALFYGKPGIVIVEGPGSDVDEFAREANRAGKSIKVKKTQKLADGKKSCHYEKFVGVAADKKGESLDTKTLLEHVEKLGLTAKYRHIIGLEDLH